MLSSALEKARSRLRIAEKAVDAMSASDDPNAICDSWVVFLNAWRGVYKQVKLAATTTPQEYQWFGRVAREKTGDQLLKYVFEARNDEEHGVERSALPHAGAALFQAESNVTITSIGFNPSTRQITLYDCDGNAIQEPVSLSEPGVALRSITARGDRIIEPPTDHFGETVNPDVQSVAKLALDYAAKLVAIAEAMHTPSQ